MSRRWPLVWSVLAVLTACESADPTSELRQLIESIEIAAEERDSGYFRGLLSEHYTDTRGNDRERLIDTIRGYFLTHQSIEVVTRIRSIALKGTDAAEVSLLAGLLGQRAGASSLSGYDGRLYDIELELVEKSGDWQIIGAQWERSLASWDGDRVLENDG